MSAVVIKFGKSKTIKVDYGQQTIAYYIQIDHAAEPFKQFEISFDKIEKMKLNKANQKELALSTWFWLWQSIFNPNAPSVSNLELYHRTGKEKVLLNRIDSANLVTLGIQLDNIQKFIDAKN